MLMTWKISSNFSTVIARIVSQGSFNLLNVNDVNDRVRVVWP